MQKFCLALDLKNDPFLIAAYEEYHKEVWPEVIESIRMSGITMMEIFRVENRLIMLVEADDEFSFSKKNEMDKSNKIVQKWEELMWIFQQRLPFSKLEDKWVLSKKIFEFKN